MNVIRFEGVDSVNHLFQNAAPDLKIGDRFTVDFPIYRKWWQFWRPRVIGNERRAFVVTDTVTS